MRGISWEKNRCCGVSGAKFFTSEGANDSAYESVGEGAKADILRNERPVCREAFGSGADADFSQAPCSSSEPRQFFDTVEMPWARQETFHHSVACRQPPARPLAAAPPLAPACAAPNASLGQGSCGGGLGAYRHAESDFPQVLRGAAASASSAAADSAPNGGTTARAAKEPKAACRHRARAEKSSFDIFHVNIQGFNVRKGAEMVATIQSMKAPPSIICISETFLDGSTDVVTLSGYTPVARRDRCKSQKCGGIIAFAKLDVAANVTLLHTSTEAERFGLIVHSDQGPFLVGVWYRPPCPGETHSITTLEEEWQQLSSGTVGTIILGDLNVHHRRWLRYSSKESAEGAKRRDFCAEQGIRQMITEPTRGPYLLDLILTDVSDIKCRVLPAIADLKAIVASLILMVPKSVTLQKDCMALCGRLLGWAAQRPCRHPVGVLGPHVTRRRRGLFDQHRPRGSSSPHRPKDPKRTQMLASMANRPSRCLSSAQARRSRHTRRRGVQKRLQHGALRGVRAVRSRRKGPPRSGAQRLQELVGQNSPPSANERQCILHTCP